MAETETVLVEAITLHSYNGQEYAPGTLYDIAADLVDSIVAQGKAKRVSNSAERGAYKTTEAHTRKTVLEPKAKQ
jgi:hypothetical protein